MQTNYKPMKLVGKSLIKTLTLLIVIVAGSCKTKQVVSLENKDVAEPIIAKYSNDTELDIHVSDTIIISGTLTYAGSEVLSVIIAGSGPTDRDCNSVVGVSSNAFLMLADSLKNAGVSSYRYDKRGVGKSTKVKPGEVDFNDFVSDASSIIEFFKDDFEHINLIGHSEGALIGTLASQDQHEVDSFVNLCGTSISLDSIAIEQLEKYPKLLDEAILHFEEIRSGQPLSEVNPMLASLFNQNVVKFFTSIMAYNPSLEQGKVKVPVLVIGGTCDIQVPEKHAKKLFKSLQPNEKNKYALIQDMGHLLKQNKSDCSDGMASYTDPIKPIHRELTTVIIDFINSVLKQETQDP